MSTQEPTMTEHDTTDAIVTIRSALYQWVPDGDLAPAIHAIDALAGRLAAAEAGTRRCTYGWCARNALTVRIDGLASRLVAAEAERDAERRYSRTLELLAHDIADKFQGWEATPEARVAREKMWRTEAEAATDGSDDDAE